MRRFPALLGAAACVLVLAGTPVAQAAPPEHFTETGSFVDRNFCGTGKSVRVAFSVKGTFHDRPQGLDFVTVHGTERLTAPSTGETVIGHFAQRVTDEFTENANGTVTIRTTIKGLPEHYRLEGGGLITRDAGIIIITAIIGRNGQLISEDITFRGPHPEAESGFTRFCRLIPEALGIA
jgi:hypothetical protein